MLSPSKVAAWLETQSFPAGAEGGLARGLLIGGWRRRVMEVCGASAMRIYTKSEDLKSLTLI